MKFKNRSSIIAIGLCYIGGISLLYHIYFMKTEISFEHWKPLNEQIEMALSTGEEVMPTFHTPSVAAAPVIEHQEHNSRININQATIEQLVSLPGIGPSKAKAIVDYRNEHGPFQSLNDLCKVKGIGKKTVAKFKDDLRF